MFECQIHIMMLETLVPSQGLLNLARGRMLCLFQRRSEDPLRESLSLQPVEMFRYKHLPDHTSLCSHSVLYIYYLCDSEAKH